MRITVPTKWSELSEWQLCELSYLFLSVKEDLSEKAFEVVAILFKDNDSVAAQMKFAKLINEAPLSVLWEYTRFLNDMPDLYKFPSLEEYGVQYPGDRLNSISVKQFSVADAIFYKWRETEEEIYLRQLVAALYTIGGRFDVLHLPDVANKTDKVPLKTLYAIGLTYLSVRNYISEKFPIVFPKPKLIEENNNVPVFGKQTSYTPFSKVISAMAMDERQPLGPLHECNATNLYEFLQILTESILRTEKQNKALGK